MSEFTSTQDRAEAEPASAGRSMRASPDPSEGLRRVLRGDETLLWSSKPHKRGWFVGHIVGFPLGFALVVAVVGGPFAAFYYVAEGGFGVPVGAVLPYAFLGWLGLSVLVAVAGVLGYRHAELALTDDRILRVGGVVGRDTSVVDLQDVRDVNVAVMPWDKLFGTGRIEVRTGGGPAVGFQLSYVADPYEVVDRIEEARSRATDGDGG